MRLIDLTGKRYGRLVVLARAENRGKNVAWECLCDCGKTIVAVGNYLKNGDTQSCGCIKSTQQDEKNLREQYDKKRVDGVAKHLFTEKARKDSSTGYRGVSKYKTRVNKEERYRAWITVDGKKYYKSGFLSPEEAYTARLALEEKYLP